MSNIKRFDPSASTSVLPSDGLTDLARKIAERQLKRKAAESLPTPTAIPVVETKIEIAEWQPAAGESPAEREKREKKEKRARVMAEVVPEWKPAEGESPAEREKREKREKRAGKMGVSFDMSYAPPSGSTYVPPPSEYALPDQSAQFEGAYGAENDYSIGSTGAPSIHPSRMAAAPILGKEKKEKDPNKEKTTAKKLYLKRKRERSKGKKAGEPLAPGKRAKKFKNVDGEAEDAEGKEDDSDESSVDSDDERDKVEAIEKKKNDIMKKKEERKIKRDEKKVEARRVKAEGGVSVAIVPRIIPTKPVAVALVVEMDIDAPPAEPTAEELELAVIEAARASRKLAKREKRTARRLPTPPPEAPSTLIPTAHEEVIRSPTPEIEMESIPQPEPAPLLRLPGATRPAPPSAKTLSALKVHESVRDKVVVDPELKVVFGENGVVLSERAIKRLGEMGITEAFAG